MEIGDVDGEVPQTTMARRRRRKAAVLKSNSRVESDGDDDMDHNNVSVHRENRENSDFCLICVVIIFSW